jgi:hypothetical protein
VASTPRRFRIVILVGPDQATEVEMVKQLEFVVETPRKVDDILTRIGNLLRLFGAVK